MTRPTSHPEDEIGPPTGWSPESAADARWRGIARLMAEGEQPARLPSEADFLAMREAIRAELARDAGGGARVLPVRPAAEETFGGWVRQIAFGGGAGGQLVRLAAVGAAAFALGSMAIRTPQAPAPRTGDIQVAVVPSATPIPAVPGPARVQTASDGGYRTFNYSLPEPGGTGMTLVRSGLDDDGRLIPSARFGIDDGSAAGAAWYVSSHGGPAWQARQQEAGTETVQLLQELRLRSLTEDDPGQLATLRQLEQALTELLTAENVLPAPKADDLGLLNQADDLVAAGRPAEALAAYRQLSQGGGDSLLGLLADFQAARLLFEDVQDYGAALAAYRAVLENHPSHYLSDEQRRHALERIDLLTRNYQDDWRAVRQWQTAQRLTGSAQEGAWRQLVAEMPQAPLAADAAVSLAGTLVQPRVRSSADGPVPEALAVLFQKALQQAGASPHAAGFRFALAEVFLVGLLEPERAEAEYRQLLTMPGAEPYAARAQARLRTLERRR